MPEKPETTTLNRTQQQLLARRAMELVKLAEQALELDMPAFELRYDIRGTAWGYYHRIGERCTIQLHPQLSALHFNDTLGDTLPHEIAHFVVDTLYVCACKAAGKKKIAKPRPHGSAWIRTMNLFGIDKPSRTHSLDTSMLDIRRQSRHLYRCACQEHQLSSTRHNRVMSGTYYTCRRCGAKLNPA